MPNRIVEDAAGAGGYPRLTCYDGDSTAVLSTLVRQPWMADSVWQQRRDEWLRTHAQPVPCKTPDGLDVFNPLDHGVRGQPLMVSASAHNRTVAEMGRLLRQALPYVEGAYECAFPDGDANAALAAEIRVYAELLPEE